MNDCQRASPPKGDRELCLVTPQSILGAPSVVGLAIWGGVECGRERPEPHNESCGKSDLSSGRVVTVGLTYAFFIAAPQPHRGFDVSFVADSLITSI